ncbi:MAG TPA: hypothetical protein VFV63_12775 [Ilumatobacteraceae bacterium]|nr:hypothetical protein [Ilumatobacteraceae bacterium]
MTATSREELSQAQVSGTAIRRAVRPPGGVTQTLSDVVVTGVTDTEVTVFDHS